jgi:hypothetical protein
MQFFVKYFYFQKIDVLVIYKIEYYGNKNIINLRGFYK